MSDADGGDEAPDGTGVRLAIVTARFNPDVTDVMRERAVAEASRLNAAVVSDVRVAGVFDLPVVVDAALSRDDVDAVVAIGAVITGETGHDVLIAHAAAHQLQRIAVRRAKPVGLGVTGPGQTRKQAEARVDRADAAVRAALDTRSQRARVVADPKRAV